jgi:hypothetical protein
VKAGETEPRDSQLHKEPYLVSWLWKSRSSIRHSQLRGLSELADSTCCMQGYQG